MYVMGKWDKGGDNDDYGNGKGGADSGKEVKGNVWWGQWRQRRWRRWLAPEREWEETPERAQSVSENNDDSGKGKGGEKGDDHNGDGKGKGGENDDSRKGRGGDSGKGKKGDDNDD